MEIIYESTQFSYQIVFVSLIVLTVVILLWKKLIYPVCAFILILVLFHSLNIRVTPNYIEWYFGFGFWKYSVPIEDIVRTKKVTTTIKNGIGIRSYEGATLYNVAVGQALVLNLKNDKTIVLGAIESSELQHAVNKALNERQ
jgi:hypothetical protein